MRKRSSGGILLVTETCDPKHAPGGKRNLYNLLIVIKENHFTHTKKDNEIATGLERTQLERVKSGMIRGASLSFLLENTTPSENIIATWEL